MSDTTITLRGRVGTDLAATRTKNGQMTVRFRLAVTNWFASADGVLTQGRTHWYTVRAWERLAENVFQSLRKGEPVIVVGRPTANAWIAKDDGLARSELVITAQSIGHDLANGRARYEKRERHWLERDNGDPSSGEVEAGELNAPPSPLEEISPSLSSSPVQDAKFMRPALPGEDEVLCGTAQEESSPLLAPISPNEDVGDAERSAFAGEASTSGKAVEEEAQESPADLNAVGMRYE